MTGKSNLFDDESDPIMDAYLGEPRRAKSKKTARDEHDDDGRHIGCPVWWLRLVFPVVRGKGELVAALYLYRLRAIHKSKTVSVPNGWLRERGIRRQAKYQMIDSLVRARVIRARRNGKSAIQVTFLR